MDVVLGIFSQLGANESLLYQLIVFVVMFILSKTLFFNHLQYVIENREEKTVKLEGNAEKEFARISKMSSEYKDKIRLARKDAKDLINSEKTKILKELEAGYRLQEQEINEFVENSRKQLNVEVEQKKVEIMSEAQSLANGLVQKLIKG